MNNNKKEPLQNSFSAYLVAAVKNRRINYLKKKQRIQANEIFQAESSVKLHTDFETQYYDYLVEQTSFVYEDWERFEEFINLLECKKLERILKKLKEKDQILLFAKLFGEVSFEELGKRFDMNPKQAEMAFYYILRKIRKEMESSGQDRF